MKSGRVVGDGKASDLMRDRDLLDSARVVQPQLVALSQAMNPGPRNPFVDPLDVGHWMGGTG